MSQREPLNKFFERWQSFPEDGADCLPPNALMALSQKPESEWDAQAKHHLIECAHCREVVKLLKGDAPEGGLYDFLAMTRERAQATQGGRAYLPEWLKSLFPTGLPSLRAASLAVSVVLLGVVWVSSDRLLQLSRPDNEVARVSFPEDSRYKAQQIAVVYAQDLNESAEKLHKPVVPLKELREYGEDFKTKAAEVNQLMEAGYLKGASYESWKASAAEFTNIYNRQVEMAMKRTDSKSTPVPSIPATGDAKTVEALYTNVARELSGKPDIKKNEGQNDSLQAEEAIKGISIGARNVKVVGIDDEGTFTIQEKNLDRKPEERKAIENAVNEFVAKRQKSVTFNIGDRSIQITPQTTVGPASAWYPRP